VSAEAVGLGQFRGAVMRGLAWKAGTQFVAQIARLVVAVVVARLLSPHDYGVAGMVLVFSSLLLVFSDLSLGAALVQREQISEADKSTVFWTSVGAGLLFTCVGIAASGAVAGFFHEPAVRPLFIALSCGFLITSVATTHSALLNRELDFKSLELRQMGGIVAGAVVIAPLWLRRSGLSRSVLGRFAIAVLGGHGAGANRLAEEAARHLGALAVVTTASATNHPRLPW